MTSREQFEHQCRNGLVNGGLAVFENGVYVSELTRAVWSGWQASRAAVEIDIRVEPFIAIQRDANNYDFYRAGIESANRAITNAGIKVKDC